MPHTEEKVDAVVRVTVRGRGSYPSYKFIFVKVAREIQPESLRHILADFDPDYESLDEVEDYDLVAMVAWWKSLQIYGVYQKWLHRADYDIYRMHQEIDALVGDNSWAPSIHDLMQGRIF